MRLILTHEQADFDAIAALLAAHLLDPAATPVLPRRVNRNVRAYLTLYGDDLPFVEAADLPKGKIAGVTLVDTQSLATLKGMGDPAALPVHIVDHHPLARDIPPTWTAAIAETGATVTLLVEAMRERGLGLSRIEATLLLLGLYEDTGGLSYAATTPRDLLAGAWLLEHGASLAVANDFLHHPITPEQRDLYQRLLDAAETHLSDGHTVVVACAEAREMVEEISTLAHKLRDLFEPDALFVLVQLESHVQLVARSLTDAIDVGRIAARFGGGGHDRAAAATVRDLSLDQARARLLELLPEHTRPRATVAEIMSHGVHTLSPDTTVAQAAELMGRYGHEGFPVVNGRPPQVIGLLTRRAVDRALAHHMENTPIQNVMEAGAVWVRPADSVEHLQRLMITHGWGQVPVVAPDDGRVLGIVTRTDLIKLLPEARAPGRRSVADLLAARLPPARLELLRRLGEAAGELNFSLYVVGGFVRDLLLDSPMTDFDLVVEGDAIALARALARKHGGRVRGHARFGTAKWLMADGKWRMAEAAADPPPSTLHPPPDFPAALDFVSARVEFYPHPTALPEVERGSIKLDLHRRDFTINTLAIQLDPARFGDLLDFWGGERDLRAGLVRVLHSISFIDDPTRILRAARLEQRLGFRLEARTQELIEHALPLLDRVSADRVRHELDSILREERAADMLGRLAGLGVLPHIHPALRWDDWLERKFAGARAAPGADEAGLFLYYALLVYRLEADELESLLARLKPARETAGRLRQVVALRSRLPELAAGPAPSAVVRLLEDYDLAVVQAAHVAADDPAVRAALDGYLRFLRHVAPEAGGETLKALGLKPGPRFRKILGALRDAWLDGAVRDAEEERELLERLVAGEADGDA